MSKKIKDRKRRGDPDRYPMSDFPAKTASRSGSNAGRGFRYQDAVSAWLAVEIWAGRRTPAILIPEGGDDVELRGEETTFIQVKSRREHLGNYSQGETTGHIEDLWKRAVGFSPQPKRMGLVLERNVVGFGALEQECSSHAIQGLIAARLSTFRGASELLPKTSITVATSPQESAIGLIEDRLKCSPIAAQMCFAELLVCVGALADVNGRLSPENYRGLSISDTGKSILDVLAAIDVDGIERALREGVCETVDFLTPLNDANFYLGVDVEPGHVAAGLVSERPRSRSALLAGIEERRAALIVGPSGAGKSALMWEVASRLRHTVRWFRIRRLNTTDIPALRQLIRTFRASEDSPLGFVMDDIGRNGPESWGSLLKEAMSVPGVVLLGSIREEDVTLIAERARAIEVRAEPDDELAERLWKELLEVRKTDWAGWREPWQLSNGLLLEYVHILTRGRRMQSLLSDQVAARISDPARSLELDILRSGAWAGATNAEINASRLARALSVSEADLSRALQRLFQEHLIRSPAPGTLAGLHQLRSEELLHLTHQMALPTLETSFERTLASVSAKDIEPLIADTLSAGRLPIAAVLSGVLIRLEREPDAKTLASALRGLGTGRISAGVDEWLETPEACALPRTQLGSAAMLGIADVSLGIFENIIPEIHAAAGRLSRIKGSPKDEPRRQLIEHMGSSTLSSLIKTADLSSLNEILGALFGVPLTAAVRGALSQLPLNLLNADLALLKALVENLSALDRDTAIQWVTEIGQEALFAKIQAETAWAGPVSIENADDGLIVRCDLWYCAGSVQGDTHEAVVSLCELILALCPSADIAMSNAIFRSGELAGLAKMPLATKRIPRENLPPPSITQWNRRWCILISQRVAAPSYTDYLSRGVTILKALVLTLHKIFDDYFRGKQAKASLFEMLNSLNAETEALTPPAISSLRASGHGAGDANTAVTKFQNLLHSTSVNLIKMFGKLPEQAGAYIGWLNGLIADVDAVIAEEPWQLIADCAPPDLTQLKTFLETLRLLAGEAHERRNPPIATWATLGKRASAGGALRLIYPIVKAAGEKRLAQRKVEIERSAMEAGIEAVFHLRIDATRLLPWPPADIIALLPATDVASAVITLHRQSKLLRSILDSSSRLTVMPFVDGIAFPLLAASGYETLLADVAGATAWATEMGMPYAPSGIAALFEDVLGLAGELGAMEQMGLGAESRPEEEIIALKSLESSFARKKQELAQHLATFAHDLYANVFALVEYSRIGEIDFVEEACIAIGGLFSDFVHVKTKMTQLLIEREWQADKTERQLHEWGAAAGHGDAGHQA